MLSSSSSDTKYPSALAVYNAINNADISDHTVNGAPLSNEASYYYGSGVGAATTAAKTVTIESITSAPAAGMTIVVTPATTSNVANPTLNLNSKGAKAIKYNNSTTITAADSGKIWTAGIPSIFVYDGTNWVFAGHGVDIDTDTTYTADETTITKTSGNQFKAKTAAVANGGTSLTTGGQVYTYAHPKTTGTTYKVGYNGTWANLGTTLDPSASGYVADNAVTAATIANAISSAVSGADISGHTVNGAPLSNEASYYYAESSTAAATVAKVVNIPSITSLQAGQIIAVKPTVTSTVANSTIKLNDFAAYPMRYRNAAITTSTDSIVWYANTVSFFVFDGSYWHFAGGGADNTTYSLLSQTNLDAGTETTGRLVSAKLLRDNFYTETETDDLLDEKQDKDTAVTHTANTAVGTQYKGVYVDTDGTVKAMTHSVNADVPSTAEFTDTTYTFATGTTNGAFTVTPEGGSAQTVSIYGWADKQNKPATAEVAAGKVLTYNGTGDANGTNNYSAKYIQVPVANNAPNGGSATVSTLADIWVE